MNQNSNRISSTYVKYVIFAELKEAENNSGSVVYLECINIISILNIISSKSKLRSVLIYHVIGTFFALNIKRILIRN